MMNYNIPITLMSLLTLVTPTVIAQQAVDRILDSSPTPTISIEHMQGNIDVQVWDKAQVQVIGTLGKDAQALVFTRSGKQINIEVESEHSNSMWGGWSNNNKSRDELTVMVPRDSEIDYEAINGTLNVTQVTQGVSAEVVNGNIIVTDTQGRHRLTTVNGDITINNASGPLRLGTVNGDVTATHTGQDDVDLESVNGELSLISESLDVTVETVNARITLDLQAVRRLDIETVNSRINASLTLLPSGKLSATSVDANMNFTFQQDISARFDLEGHAGGRFTNNLTADKTQKDEYGPGRWLNFTTGEGDAKVDIETVSGKVTLSAR